MSEVPELVPGAVLIAVPPLLDPNFYRSVVLLCEHGEEGSFGLVLNRATEVEPGQVLESLEAASRPVRVGGPVQPDTLHFLHGHGDLIPSSILIADGLWWGGDFEVLQEALGNGLLDRISFFLGYSGWGEQQLDDEFSEGSWLTCPVSASWVFDTDPDRIWREAVLRLGGDYALLANYPDDPRMN